MIHDIDAKNEDLLNTEMIEENYHGNGGKKFTPRRIHGNVYVYLGLLWATASLDSRDTTLKSKARAGNLLFSP